LLSAPSARADEYEEDIPRSGAFNLGVHFDVGAGINELLSSGTLGVGVYPRFGVEVELGAHFNIVGVARLHRLFETKEPAIEGSTITPGLLYRMRSAQSPWAFGFGLGARLGGMPIPRGVLGLPPSTTSSTQYVTSFPVAPDATLMLEFWPLRWLGAKAAVGYAFVLVDGTPVHAIEQSLMATFAL